MATMQGKKEKFYTRGGGANYKTICENSLSICIKNLNHIQMFISGLLILEND